MSEEEVSYGDMEKFRIKKVRPSHDDSEVPELRTEENAAETTMRQEVEGLIRTICESLETKETTHQKLDAAVAKLTLMEFRIVDFMPMVHAGQSPTEIANLLMKWRRAQGRLN